MKIEEGAGEVLRGAEGGGLRENGGIYIGLGKFSLRTSLRPLDRSVRRQHTIRGFWSENCQLPPREIPGCTTGTEWSECRCGISYLISNSLN